MAADQSRDWFVLRRWLLVAFVTFILTILAGIYITEKVLPKTYTAEVLVKVYVPRYVQGDSASLGPEHDSGAFLTQLEMIMSQQVLQPVIDQLGVRKTYSERLRPAKVELTNEGTLALLRQRLNVSVIRGTNLIKIAASSEVPQEAADIANSVAAHYRALRIDEYKKRVELGIDTLRDQITGQQKTVDDKKAAFEQLKATAGTTEAEKDKIKRTEGDLDRNQTLLDTLKDRLKQDLEASQLEESPVVIVQTAEVPESQSSPNRIVDFGLSLAAGLFLGILVATFVELAIRLIAGSV